MRCDTVTHTEADAAAFERRHGTNHDDHTLDPVDYIDVESYCACTGTPHEYRGPDCMKRRA